jgi:uncharacterized protein (UPF0128 family)
LFSRVHDIKEGLRHKYRYTPYKTEYEPLEEKPSTRRIIKANRMLKKAASVLDKLRKQMEARNKIAATVIARFWKKNSHNSTKRLIKKFLDIGLMGDKVKEMGFKALVPFLRQEHVIKATNAILQRFHSQAVRVHGDPVVAPEDFDTVERVRVRIVLASYMIAFFPRDVFESMGTLEKELHECALGLVECFEEMIDTYDANDMGFTGIGFFVRDAFSMHLFDYLIIFKKWKVPDEAKLTVRIRNALFALHNATLQLPSDEDPNSRLCVELRTQTTRLFEKLRQVAGADAVTQLRAEIAAQNSNAIYSGTRGVIGYTNKQNSEELAHQLHLDPLFQLAYMDSDTPCVRFFLQEAFWSTLRDDMLLPNPVYDRATRSLNEIREAIADVSKYTEEQLDEILDVGFVNQRLVHDAFDWSDAITIGQRIYRVIKFFQSPKHDAESQAKWDSVKAALESATNKEEMVKAFEGLLRFCLDRFNIMRIDMANTRFTFYIVIISLLLFWKVTFFFQAQAHRWCRDCPWRGL